VSKHEPGVPTDRPKKFLRRRRADKTDSIKKRVIRVALIPSIALILLWVAAAAYLGGTAFYNQQVAKSVREVSIPAVTGLGSIEKERQLSISYLAQPTGTLQPLLAQQKISDQGMGAMKEAAGPALAHAPDSITSRMAKLTGYLDKLPNIRGRIDASAASPDEVATFYDGLLDAATDLFGTQARVVPDAAVVPGAIAAANVFHISDLMSRSSSQMSGALASGNLSRDQYLEYTRLVGSYHALLDTTASDLRPQVQAQYKALTDSESWRNLVTVENALIEKGPWSGGAATSGVPINLADWQNLTNSVSAALTQITITQADQVSAQALSDGNSQLWQLGIALAIALLVVIGSIWLARRQSAVLVDSALTTRLGKLRADAQDLVTNRLPEIVGRLRNGKPVDTEKELPELHYGESDEIGQVAHSISTALREAVTAAAGEAQARNALNTLFRGIARRNQLPLYNLLNLLDTLEQAEQDSASLERLYRLDHEATRARRNSENLIILSGGDIGQHLPGPVRMRDVLRSAISETHEYKRVKLKGSVPDTWISSDAATGLIHLVAELLENAARFSPPSYEVLVKCLPAQAGMIIEVEDRGLGIPAARREQLNEMLSAPPDVDVMAIGDGSQLGFWVIASLVRRFGFKVALRESDYGGTLAIVRVPSRLVISDPEASSAPQSTSNGVVYGSDGSVHASEPAAVAAPVAVLDGRRRFAADDDPPTLPRIPIPNFTRALVNPADELGGPGTDRPVHGHLPAEGPRANNGAATTPQQQNPRVRPPLPERSPGEHLNPRLTDETDSSDSTESAPWDGGASLSAFQQGSEAGRRADAGHDTDRGTQSSDE
jgi:signal transduction histidine kinase